MPSRRAKAQRHGCPGKVEGQSVQVETEAEGGGHRRRQDKGWVLLALGEELTFATVNIIDGA